MSSERGDKSESDDIAELESEYQTDKILASDTTVQAEIIDAAWGENNVYLTLDIIGGHEYPVMITTIFDSDDADDVIELYRGLNLRPSGDLTELRGKKVKISKDPSNSNNIISLKVDNKSITAREVEPNQLPDTDRQLSEKIVEALRRAFSYRVYDKKATGVGIDDINRENDNLVLRLEQGWGSISVQTSGASDETPYTRLIESVGKGSVEQIKGSKLYFAPVSAFYLPDDVVRRDKIANRAETGEDVMKAVAADSLGMITYEEDHFDDTYDDFILLIEDPVCRWVVFGSEPSTETRPLVLLGYLGAVLIGILSIAIQNSPLFLLSLSLAVVTAISSD